jgi:arylsulfatase A-like enzyme
MRDIFFRWDGFRFVASFLEYIPAVALISILWTIVSFLTTIFGWISFWLFERLFHLLGLRIRRDHLLLYGVIFSLLGAVTWKAKKLLWVDVQTSYQLKMIVLASVVLLSVCPTWMLRNKANHWWKIIQGRITPLVWLFGIWVMLSVPQVVYHAIIKKEVNNISSQVSKGFADEGNRPNIVLVTFDALTSRDMSVYGYHRETTPFISKWAEEASLFTRLEAEGNHTGTTVTSIMTGKRAWTHQTYHVFELSRPIRGDIENLSLQLKNSGYYSIGFVVNPYVAIKRLGMSKSFDVAPLPSEFWESNGLGGDIEIMLHRLFGDKIKLYLWILQHNFVPGDLLNKSLKYISGEPLIDFPPAKAFNRFLSILDNASPEPFFAWIHLFPPHDPYTPPDPYRGIFHDKQTETENDFISRDSYDEYIRYCDREFENFITQLTKRNKLKNSIIILSADHGESFEHNYAQHGGPHLYEQVTHIPLIIKEPGQTEGHIIHDLVEQVDVPATILDFANIAVPSWMEGRSLVPLMRGKKISSKPAFSMNFEKNPSRGHQISKGTIAVWEGNYKLIHYLEDNKSLLFNLKDDPDELHNFIDTKPDITLHLLDLIKANLKRANERIKSDNSKDNKK